jgi:hypothetical protein
VCPPPGWSLASFELNNEPWSHRMLGLFNVKNRSQETFSPAVAEPGTQYQERRRSSRVEIELLVSATTEDGNHFYGYTRDLSREGTRVFIRGQLTVGERITLTFRLSGESDEISMTAIVRSAMCERYGIEFCETETAYHDEQIVTMCKQLVLSDFANVGELVGCS